MKIFVFGSVLWLKDLFLETIHCQIEGECLHMSHDKKFSRYFFRIAVSVFVAAWKYFQSLLHLKIKDQPHQEQLASLSSLISQLIYYEVEKILFDETSREILECSSNSNIPTMQDIIFLTRRPSRTRESAPSGLSQRMIFWTRTPSRTWHI